MTSDRDSGMRRDAVSALPSSFPWTASLPVDEREEFVRALTSATESGTPESPKRLIDGWRAAAKIHADPALGQLLNAPHAGSAVKLDRPTNT